MPQAYVPKGKNRKSKIQLAEAAEKYLSNGRYDQRKSDMIAVTHKEKIGKTQKLQAFERKKLHETALTFISFERLVEKTLVCAEDLPKQMVSPSQMQVAPAETKINNLRTPGALVQSSLLTTGAKQITAPKRKYHSQKKKSSFSTGLARL